MQNLLPFGLSDPQLEQRIPVCLYRRWRSIASGVVAKSPASTGRTTPVIHRASSLARNTAAQATSQAVPSVPRGPACLRSHRSSSVMPAATIGV